jgi:raffinose/stachyose/melibiose transport system permease protein
MTSTDTATAPQRRSQPSITSTTTAPAPRRRSQAASPFAHWWWAFPGIALAVIVHYIATAAGGFFSLTDWSGLGDFEFIGFDNYVRIFNDPTQVGAIRNTVVLALGILVITQVIGLGLALGLNRGLKSRYVLRVLFFIPTVLSPLAVAYVWKFLFDYTGPLNGLLTWLGFEHLVRPWLADPNLALFMVLIVICWQGTGITMVIYLAGLASVAPETEEAAAIDGAGVFARFWHVVLPSLRPALAISTTLTIISGLRTFDEIMALTGGGPAGTTETLATAVYKQSFALGQFGYGAALALVMTLIILVFAVFQQRLTNGEGKES